MQDVDGEMVVDVVKNFEDRGTAPDLPVVQDAPAVQTTVTPATVALSMIEKNVNPESMEKVLALIYKDEDRKNKKAYNLAMAQAQKQPPKILKTEHVKYKTSKGVTEYYHANLGDVSAAICEWLSDFGFMVSWKHLEQTKDWIKMRCIIRHELGHSESTELGAPPDNSGGKNTIQAIASTTSYLERYTVLALTGQSTHDMDNDGRGNAPPGKEPVEKITEEQLANLKAYCESKELPADTTLQKIAETAYSLDNIESLRADWYENCIEWIDNAAK